MVTARWEGGWREGKGVINGGGDLTLGGESKMQCADDVL